MAYPSVHPDAPIGARYRWKSSGNLPVIPDEIACRLMPVRFSSNIPDMARLGAGDLESLINSFTEAKAPALLRMRVEDTQAKFKVGSRHEALKKFLWFGFRDVRAGLYSGQDLVETALDVFLRFKPRDEWSSPGEFLDLVRWTAAASSVFSDEELELAQVRGIAYSTPGVAAWLKAVSNV